MQQYLPQLKNTKAKKQVFSLLYFFLILGSINAQNPTSGGTIAPSIQEICTGQLPAKITSSAPASGGDPTLSIEYMWMYTTTFGGTAGGNSYTPIPNSNSECYDPGIVAISTYFVRCSRRVGSGNPDFTAESNIAAVVVLPALYSSVIGNPGIGYRGLEVNLTAYYAGGNVDYEWDVDGNGTIDDTGLEAYFVFNEPGNYNINLTVTVGNCSYTYTSPILINELYSSNIADPCNCADPLNLADYSTLTYYNHDYILLSSNPGEIWTVTNNGGSGNPVFHPGLDPILLGEHIDETTPGIYYRDIWYDGTQGPWQVTLQSNYGYSITLNSGVNGPCIICPNSPLPVELKNFRASVEQNETILKWETTSELNNNHFNIERSLDGTQFQTIGVIDGQGTSNTTNFYAFKDERSISGETYYRLKQIDFDGKYEYSNIVSVRINGVKEDLILSVSPNPIEDQAIVRFRENIDPNSTLELFASTGQVIQTYQLNVWSNSLEINLKNVSEGIYMLSVKNAKTGRKSFYKVVKN